MERPAKILLGCTALFWFSQYTYPILLAEHAQSALGASAALAGQIVGSYGFVQMALRIPLGFFSDKLGRRKPFIQGGILMTVLAGLLLFFARTPALALVGRGSAGAAASSWAAFTVLFAAYQGEGQRTRAMSLLSATMSGAQLLASVCGSLLAGALGTRSTFLLAAGAGLLALLLSGRITEPPAAPASMRAKDLLPVLRNWHLWLCGALSILLQVVSWSTTYGFSPLWATEVLGATMSELGLLSILQLLPMAVLSLAAGSLLAPRFGERACTLVGFALLALSCLLMPRTTAFWQMLCLQALCGIGMGCASPMLLAECIRFVAPSLRGLGMGLYQAIYGIGMFLGPLIAGLVVQGAGTARGGYQRVVWLCALVAGSGALGSLLLPRRAGEERRVRNGLRRPET